MSKIKVIHAIGGGEFGGAEHHILDLLPSLSDLSVEPLVVCFYNSTFAEELRKRNIRVIPLDHYQRFDIRLLKALIRLFKEEKPDIIHTHGVKANFFLQNRIQVPAEDSSGYDGAQRASLRLQPARLCSGVTA